MNEDPTRRLGYSPPHQLLAISGNPLPSIQGQLLTQSGRFMMPTRSGTAQADLPRAARWQRSGEALPSVEEERSEGRLVKSPFQKAFRAGLGASISVMYAGLRLGIEGRARKIQPNPLFCTTSRARRSSPAADAKPAIAGQEVCSDNSVIESNPAGWRIAANKDKN